MKRTALPSLLVVIILSLSACAASGLSPDPTDDGGGGGPGSSDRPNGSEDPADAGADEVLLSVTSQGGFVPAEFAVSQVPSFVLLADGRVITQGPTTLEFPGPLLPPLQVRQLTDDGVQQVLDGVIETELFETDLNLRAASNFIADAADTVFTLQAGDRDVTVTVYGLGALDPSIQSDGISAAEIEAHGVLQQLNEQLTFIDQSLPATAFADDGWQPFVADAYRLYVRDATGDPEGELPGQVREWPTDDDPSAIGDEVELFGNGTRCAVVDGADWGEELAAANQNTRWTPDGETLYAITLRPLLPYEERTCPELAPGG
jgi:hypothetical protein